MYFKLPLGFSFKSSQTTKDIIDNQLYKLLKTWKNQRIYKPKYGIDWRQFNYDRVADDTDQNQRLLEFLTSKLKDQLPQINPQSVELQNTTNPNNFNFYLIYKYKDIFTSKIYVDINLQAQVDVQLKDGNI